MSRLVPSMRPIDATACGLWPTPTTQDHKDSIGMSFEPRKDGASRLDLLPRQVYWIAQNTPTALWPTQTASLADKAIRTPEGARREVERGKSPDLAAHGMALAGSSATTEKPGALAPGFVSWLMGFPPEWLDCAPDAMPKKPRKSK